MDDLAKELIEKERAALDRWIRGDTQGFAALCDPDVSYFDTNVERRPDSLAAVQQHLASYADMIRAMLKERGKAQMDGTRCSIPNCSARATWPC